MIIAVAFDNGDIHSDFRLCPVFALYYTDESGRRIVMKKLVETYDGARRDPVELMSELGVGAVVCGSVDERSGAALAERGITVYACFEGDADAAADVIVDGGLAGGCGGSCCGGCGDSGACGGGCGDGGGCCAGCGE